MQSKTNNKFQSKSNTAMQRGDEGRNKIRWKEHDRLEKKQTALDRELHSPILTGPIRSIGERRQTNITF